jgi:hypothetical protein
MRNHIWFGVVLAVLAACGTTNIAEDGENDSFSGGGKADGGGIAEGTPEAIGVLRVANDASLATLKSGVGLTKRTASNIIGFRAGADATLGTSDDRGFRTLAELDAVRYVGPVAFEELLAYAESQGDVPSDDLFAAAPAGQRVASYDDVLRMLPAGASFANLGRFNLFEQHRDCGPSSCAPWQDTASLVFTTVLDGGPGGQQVFQTLPLEGDVYLVAVANYPKANLYLELQGDPDAAGNRLFMSCFVGPYTGDSSRAVIAARGLETCSTSVTGFDEIAIERAGHGPLLDRLWGIQISDVANVVPIDWGGASASDLGYVTASHLALVANQSADYYHQTARLAVAADLSAP